MAELGTDESLSKAQSEQTAATVMLTCVNTPMVECCWECGECISTFISSGRPRPKGIQDTKGSVIDHGTMQHVHIASDWAVTKGSVGCSSCGSSAAGGKVPELALGRFHRYRDLAIPASFGPGVFHTYDAKVFFYDLDGGKVADVFDPTILGIQRYVDGATSLPNDPGDTEDGDYVSYRTNASRELILYSGTLGNLTEVTDPEDADYAILTNYVGYKFYFEMIDLSGADVTTLGNGLQAHLKLDETGSVFVAQDATTNDRDGTVTESSGDPEWTTGQVNGALDLDDTGDKIELDGGTSGSAYKGISGENERTVTLWVKTSTNSSDQTLVKWGEDAASELFEVLIQDGTGEEGPAGAIQVNVNGGYVVGEEDVTDGSWHHIAVVLPDELGTANTNHVRIYVDGRLQGITGGVASDIDTDTTNGTNVIIGDGLTGVIDDVRIYDRVLTDDEVRDIGGANAELAGRLVRIEDRNDYKIEVAYNSFTPTEIAESPARQWQIDTVTDANDRTITFTYEASQVSGQWAVDKVTLPNTEEVDYNYSGGYLSAVVHPDGTDTAITRSFNTTANCTVVAYDDAAAAGTHRRKDVYLTANVNAADEAGFIVPQASNLIRMMTNGEDEVSYLNIPGGAETFVYEGTGVMKRVYIADFEVKKATDWNVTAAGGGAIEFADVSFTNESTFDEFIWSDINVQWYVRQPPTIRMNNGVLVDVATTGTFAYSEGSLPRKKSYDDDGDGQRDDSVERWTYNSFDQVTRYEDRLGRVTKWTYDANGNVTKKEVGIVNDAVYEQVTPDRADASIDDKHVTIANGFARDEYAVLRWRYFGAAHANAGLLQTTYDANYPDIESDVNFDPDSDLIHRTDFEYNAGQFLTKVIEGNDLASQVQGDRAVTEYTYDTAGRLATSKDPVGRDVEYFYDERDRTTMVQYHDDSTERWAYGNDADKTQNLVVAHQDRQGTVTSHEYDDHGRRTKTIAASYQIPIADVKDDTITDLTTLLIVANEITDVSVKIEKTCTYYDGTNIRKVCVDSGEKSEYGYDYRQRLVETIVNPRDGKALTTTRAYKDNKLFSSTDAYGRTSYNLYRASDASMIRSVMGLVPGYSLADYTAVSNATRDLEAEDATPVGNARFLVTDYEKDVAGQTTATVDPRNIEYEVAYDSRGRSFERKEAAGTTVEAKTVTKYDANSNAVEVQSPRYFDATDTNGNNKANVEMTYTGRNLLKKRTVAADDTGMGGVAADEEFAYNKDRTIDTKTDFRTNDWLTIWDPCCRRVIAQVQPAADVDGSGTNKHAVSWQNYNLYGDVVHTGTIYVTDPANVPTPPLSRIVDLPDSETVHESTAVYDARHRPTATTRWLEAKGAIDPNGSVPIAAPYETTKGLTTRYFYDEDLTDLVGLDNATGVAIDFANAAGTGTVSGNVSIKKLLDELKTDDDVENGGDGDFYDSALQDGYATVVINPEGEISVAITDGTGRTVATGVIEPPIVAGVANANANDPITWGTTHYDTVVTLTSRFSNGSGGTQNGDAVETFTLTALNHKNHSRTDAAGRTIEALDALDKVTFLSYNNNSGRIHVRDANNVGLDCEFDPRNRDIKCTDTQGDITETKYDDNNNVIETEDAKNKDTLIVYDARSRRSQVTDRNTGVTKYGYDDNSNLIEIIDADDILNGITDYTYDARNLKIECEYPDHSGGSPNSAIYGIVKYSYDAAGRSRVNTDQLGDTVTYVFDMADRLTNRNYASPLALDPDAGKNDSFTYDAASRMLTAVSIRYNNTVTFAYDDASRLSSESLAVNFGTARTYTTTHAYDDDNRRTQSTYPDGSQVNKTYTDRDQLNVTDYDADGTGAGLPTQIADMDYDDGMREIKRIFGNGLTRDTAYRGTTLVDGDNMITDIDVYETATPANTRPGLSFDYTYDANKNPLTETTGGNMANYSWTTAGGLTQAYDDEDRLTYWERSNLGSGTINTQEWPINHGTTGLSYVGDWDTVLINGASQSRTHNFAHELTAIAGGAQTFDFKGNQLRLAADTVNRFSWDFDNKMKTADPDQDSTVELEFTYDALGRRVSKADSSGASTVTTVYVCAGQQVFAEYTGSARSTTPTCKYVYATYVDDPLILIKYNERKNNDGGDGDGGLGEAEPSGIGGTTTTRTEVLYYYHANRQFSVPGMTNASGVVVERYAYTAYGVTTILAPDGSTVRATSSVGNSYMYTGRRLDKEFATGSEDTLYYYRARYYDPQQGRFIGRDPLEYVDGMTLYGYTVGSPFVYVDPSGLNPGYAVAGGVAVLPIPGARPVAAGIAVVTTVAIGVVAAWNWATSSDGADPLVDTGPPIVDGPDTERPPIPRPIPREESDTSTDEEEDPKPDPKPDPWPTPIPIDPNPDEETCPCDSLLGPMGRRYIPCSNIEFQNWTRHSRANGLPEPTPRYVTRLMKDMLRKKEKLGKNGWRPPNITVAFEGPVRTGQTQYEVGWHSTVVHRPSGWVQSGYGGTCCQKGPDGKAQLVDRYRINRQKRN